MYRSTNLRGLKRLLAVGALSVSALMVLSACGASDGPIGESGSSNAAEYTELRTGEVEPSEADTAALEALPESVRDNYAGFWHSTRLGPNPYADWTPPEGPWKLCYSSLNLEISWYTEGLTVAEMLTDQLREQGLVEEELVHTDASNDGAQQANQINNLVQQGCDVIFAMQPPSVGVCNAFGNARDEGTLVIAVQTGTDCTNVIHSDFGGYAAAYRTAEWLAENADPDGTVVLCNGIPGVAASESRQAGAEAALEDAGREFDSITGEWNPATVKTQMLQYLSTHQGEVSGVWDAGVCAVAAGQAMEQAGHDIPLLTGFDGACGWLAYTQENGVDTVGFAQSGGQAVVEGFKVAMRMLSGQKPVVNSLIYPLAEINPENVDQFYDPKMTINSSCNAQPVDGESVPDSYYDDLFEGGEEAPKLETVLQDLPIQ